MVHGCERLVLDIHMCFGNLGWHFQPSKTWLAAVHGECLQQKAWMGSLLWVLYWCGKYLECNIDVLEWFSKVLEQI